ncbi:conserved Plasmodium protein, unknown function [Plasmodium gallinaceum]|uniref:Uncharacterized protein n=1 Tax=Plasmodium gallinaceum TaxID=5849 RepID=A0A1J1GX68_PLAGA|nr:conserved Plasmodium protein, unknown function [Plasmodium gallinaceum]CRG96848.1 conserved Plasmodium protein, unknown function [Plasmodium gallinaceum]
MNIFCYSIFYLILFYFLINILHTKKLKTYSTNIFHYDIKINKYKKLFILKNGKFLKKKKYKRIYSEKIKDINSLIGAHVKINNGMFKGCNGIILDLKKTEKSDYETLVVINKEESIKYPKEILNKLGKSYWMNIKDIEIKKLKNLFFHNYDNFYDKKEKKINNEIKNFNNIKENFVDVDENFITKNLSELKYENSSDDIFDINDEYSEFNKESIEEKYDETINKGVTEVNIKNSNINYDENDLYKLQEKKKKDKEYNYDSYSDLISLKENYLKEKKNVCNSFCHNIIKEIEKNYIYKDLLNLYKNKRHLSNIVVCFYILKQFVRIYNFVKNEDASKNNFLNKVINDNNFESILIDIKFFLEKKKIYRVIDKTWLLWLLVKLNIHNEEKYKKIFESILCYLVEYINYDILRKLNTKSLSALMWSLAKCSYKNLKIYKKILYFIKKYITILSCQDISNIYYSLSLLNYNEENFYELIENEINKNINKFTLQSLINMFWGMTKLKRKNSTFNIIKDKLLFYSSNLDIRDVSLFLWCLNKNQYYKVDINFKGQIFQNLNIKQAIQLLIFFNYNKKKYIEYLKYVLNFLFENINNLTNQEICFFIYSLSKLNLLKKSFFKIKNNILKRDPNTLNLADINMLIFSLNNSNLYDKTIINYLFNSLKNILNHNIKSTLNNIHNNGIMKEKRDYKNLNNIIKNLAEMKIFDQNIILKYVVYFSLNASNNYIDELIDYLFYTTSFYYPNDNNNNYNEKEINEKYFKYEGNINSEDTNVDLIIKNNEIKLEEEKFKKIYLYYLNKIILFLQDILDNFNAESFLEEIEYDNFKNKDNFIKDSMKKNDTFKFNYHSEKDEDIKKLNELILDKKDNKIDNLENLISDKEYSSFINEKEEKKSNSKVMCKSLNSLIHLYYSFSLTNSFDKNKIDFYFDNLYYVVNNKRNEITAYQWLLIKDIVNIMKIDKKEWVTLLDKVNTYVNNNEEGSEQFETINIDI